MTVRIQRLDISRCNGCAVTGITLLMRPTAFTSSPVLPRRSGSCRSKTRFSPGEPVSLRGMVPYQLTVRATSPGIHKLASSRKETEDDCPQPMPNGTFPDGFRLAPGFLCGQSSNQGWHFSTEIDCRSSIGATTPAMSR